MITGFRVQDSGFRHGGQWAVGSRQLSCRRFHLAQPNCLRPAANCQLRRRGLSIVEVLISLSISALLLTAVAAAFSASSQVIEHNDEFFRASQSARVAMNQLLNQIRRCERIDDQFLLTDTIKIHTASDDWFTYYHNNDDADKKNWTLNLATVDIADDPDYVLARNITSLRFDYDTVPGANNARVIVRVTVTLTVEVGGNQVRLSGSAAPRRAQTYAN